jgi:hypothetical protein
LAYLPFANPLGTSTFANPLGNQLPCTPHCHITFCKRPLGKSMFANPLGKLTFENP